jgi:hypothetical protein
LKSLFSFTNCLIYISASNATDGKQLLRIYNTSTSSVATGRNNAIYAETGVYTGSGGSWALGRSSGAILGYENSTTGTYSYGVAGYHYGNTANTPHAAVFGGSNFTSTTNVPLTNGALGYQFDASNAYGVYGFNTWTGSNAYGGYFSATGAATTNYGIYATASGATNNFAAYFGGSILVDKVSTTPACASGQTVTYTKGVYYVIMYNDAGTPRYRYFDQTSTANPVVWTYSTTAP